MKEDLKKKLLEELVALMGERIGNKVKPKDDEADEDPAEEATESPEEEATEDAAEPSMLKVEASGKIGKDLKSRIEALLKKKGIK